MPALEFSERVEQEILDYVETAQKAVLEGTKGVAEAVVEAVPNLPAFPLSDQVPAPSQMVDLGFDLAEKLLASQRKFSRELLETVEGVIWMRPARPAVAAAQSA